MQFDQLARREFITLLDGAAASWPLTAHAQQADNVRRIGVLMGVAERDPDAQPRVAAFERALQDLGWINGRSIPVRDFSGVVSAIGEGVKDITVGDAAFGVCEAGQEGTYAEKIAIKAAIVAKKPSDLSHDNAAALALIGLTALSAIEDTLKLQRDETILIQGGGGGRRRFCHPACQTYRCSRDHDGECGKPCLYASAERASIAKRVREHVLNNKGHPSGMRVRGPRNC